MVDGGRTGTDAVAPQVGAAAGGCGCAGDACPVPPAPAGASKGDRLRLTQLSSKAG